MIIRVEIAEAAERFEELVDLAARHDEVLICREGQPIGAMRSLSSRVSPHDEFLRLATMGRASVPAGTTSNHDDFYDNYGLPK